MKSVRKWIHELEIFLYLLDISEVSFYCIMFCIYIYWLEMALPVVCYVVTAAMCITLLNELITDIKNYVTLRKSHISWLDSIRLRPLRETKNTARNGANEHSKHVKTKKEERKCIRHRFFFSCETRSFFRRIHNSIHLPKQRSIDIPIYLIFKSYSCLSHMD